ncbi:MAG: hypothetical protein HOA67_00940 [Candidatus Marinimicrobia bacterium]|nr:hypothetical protein [Candidatus Neomarinimicrobiota bacterium]
MTKTKKETSRHWTVELNIGSKRNMGKLKHSKSSGYRYDYHDLNTVRKTVVKRFDGGSGNIIKSMFEFDNTYKDEPEKSYYIAFSFYGGLETFKDVSGQNKGLEGEYMEYSDRNILEDKLLILCMELELDCISYNIKEWTSSTFYPTGKQDLIYHPNYDGEQMIFEDEYFYTFGYHKLSSFDKLHSETTTHVTNTETVG